jgi:hypothetical protein
MAQELIIQVYNNIASGAPPIQVIETEVSNSSIFIEPQEDVTPINIQVYENTTSGTFPIQVIESEFTGVPIFIEIQEDYAPVQSVNGKIGWVVINKNDVGLSNVENVSITGVSGYFQNNINNLSGYANTNYVTKVSGQFVNRPTVNGTGILLSGEAAQLPNSIVYSSGNSQPTDLLIKYVTGINSGITSYEGVFPNIYFTENPVLFISLSYDNTDITSINLIPGKNRYFIDLSYRNQTGFGVIFSDQISETGLNLNVLAYGKGVNL